ncbi:MAG: prolyl oligopeptidase family serine peptidase [bacterium]
MYPETRKADTVHDYHGTKVADPYSWLEDDNSAETKAWVEAQNKITFGYLENVTERAKIAKRLTELWNYEKFGVPFEEGGRYFFTRNDGLQNQSVLYWAESLDAAPKVLIDPNAMSKDGTVALAGVSVSKDGKFLAYGIAEAGSDWNRWKIREVATGKDLDDELKWIKFSGAAWNKENNGFYYGRYPEPKPGQNLTESNYFQKVYFHRVGTPQSEDALIWEDTENKDWRASAAQTDDGRFLIVTIGKGTDDKYRLLFKDLYKRDLRPPQHFLGNFDADYTFIDNEGPNFFFRTNKDAPRGKVIAVDVFNPEPTNWKTIIPEAAETLDGVSLVGDKFIAQYLKDARSQVKLFAIDGKPVGEVAFPGLGTAAGFGGRRKDKETFYSFTTFTSPAAIYRYDVAAGTSSVYRQPKLAFDPANFVTEQVFYTSKDGTRVPMFISHKKGLKKDGATPTYLYGYGGFNISLTPTFSPANLAWMEAGGIFALPNLRGGGEYGEAWHQGGTKLNKQNVFDDFIGAAEWLIKNGYTKSEKLAIGGGSNGGLLVGACMTQRPDLYGAALPAVGVMDMLRFHKFTIGWAWIDDYGSSDNAEQFKALYAYSPLHNLKTGTKYPSTMVTTADHDDRVVPAHSFKFAARLQESHAGENPVLIRIETRAGHGAGKPTSKMIEEAADKWAFLVKSLGMKWE